LTTTALILIPCLLTVLTVLWTWVLPSGLWYRSKERDELVSRPVISDPNNGNNKSVHASSQPNTNISEAAESNTAAPKKSKASFHDWNMVPKNLLSMGIYDEDSDFVNELGIKPTGWERPNGDPNIWGPCKFVPRLSDKSTAKSLVWSDRRRHPLTNDTISTLSPEYYRNADVGDFDYSGKNSGKGGTMGGWCRPGFLIIGAGKCGTSSLYHYLMGHPRVLPAEKKQIHYFHYRDSSMPLKWYYGNFPTPQSFLEHGGLVTGEASPGYLPYPDVARNAYMAWKGSLSTSGAGVGSMGMPLTQFLSNPSYKSMVPEVPPRIIAIGREPFDRIYSSYKYNYVVPTLESLRTNGHPRIPTAKETKNDGEDDDENKFHLHRDDEYYQPYLFSLEEFVRAELKQLKGCFYDWGPQKTYTKWYRKTPYKDAVKRRNQNFKATTNIGSNSSQPQPLIDLDGVCYGKSVSKTVYRQQWSEMQTNNPRKVLLNRNLHLTQALIGRSIYLFPLEWWYLNFRPDPDDASTINSITFVCTEEMTKPDTLNDLTARLGLPEYDGFESVIAEGAYNVGGHRGYDTATSWEELQLEHNTNETLSGDSISELSATGTETIFATKNKIDLSEDLYQELKEFIDPLNERLFALTGKRCDW